MAFTPEQEAQILQAISLLPQVGDSMKAISTEIATLKETQASVTASATSTKTTLDGLIAKLAKPADKPKETAKEQGDRVQASAESDLARELANLQAQLGQRDQDVLAANSKAKAEIEKASVQAFIDGKLSIAVDAAKVHGPAQRLVINDLSARLKVDEAGQPYFTGADGKGEAKKLKGTAYERMSAQDVVAEYLADKKALVRGDLPANQDTRQPSLTGGDSRLAADSASTEKAWQQAHTVFGWPNTPAARTMWEGKFAQGKQALDIHEQMRTGMFQQPAGGAQ